MKIKTQWLVYFGGTVMLVLTENDGYFLQKGVYHEFHPIKKEQAEKLLEKYK